MKRQRMLADSEIPVRVTKPGKVQDRLETETANADRSADQFVEDDSL